MANNVTFTNLDFLEVKNGLKEYLKGQTRFKDYDFEGSNMSVLLDILAYNAFHNNVYTNMAFSEMFLDSAQLRDSVISHAKELNYLPGSRSSSQVKLDVTLTVNDAPAYVEIPRGTKFKAICGSKTYYFVSDESVSVIPDTSGNYVYTGLPIYEGEVLREYYTVTADSGNSFVINNNKVDTNSIRVYVKDNSSSTTSTEYLLAKSLFGVTTNDNVFYVEPFADERYTVTFGQDKFGNQPIVGNVIVLEYRICSGEEPNGTKRFTPNGTISGYAASATLNSESSTLGSEGGAEREDIASIKYYAPKSLQIQDRAVTESDYEILLKNQFSEIQAVSVYGGEEANPPQFGRVIVAVDAKNSDGISDAAKKKYTDFLKARSPLTVTPVVISPDFMYISVDASVKYNRNITSKSTSDIKTLVASAISTYNSTELADFRKTLRYSKLIGNIDDADISIISNDTKITSIIEINPALNTYTNFSIDFENELAIEHALSAGEDLSLRNPTIMSSEFTYLGNKAFIQDDGAGKLQIVSNTTSGATILNNYVGYVTYSTGYVNIQNFKISAYSGSAVKIYATTKAKDIIGPKKRIVSIRAEDVNITVTGTNL